MAKTRPSDYGDENDNHRPTKKQSTIPLTKSELPNHLIFDAILRRLPTNSVVRFRSVCKSWDSFIRDPSFVQFRRSAGHIHGHRIFISPESRSSETETWDLHVFSAPIHRNNEERQIAYSSPANYTHILTMSKFFYGPFGVQSVNGFLCFHHLNGEYRFSFTDNAFAQILNPTTGQFINLPLEDTSSLIPPGATVAIHFGFDPLRDEFKILRFYKISSVYDFKILTIGSDSRWRRIKPETPFDPMRCDFILRKRGFYSNGAIHWMDGIDKIVAFDVGIEGFRTIWICKKHVTHLIDHHELVEVDGCLSVIGYKFHRYPEHLWILKDYKSNLWIEECINGLPYKIMAQNVMVLPLCKVLNSHIIMFLPYIVHKLVRINDYDMKTRSFVSNVFMELHQLFWPYKYSVGVNMLFAQENFKVLKL